MDLIRDISTLSTYRPLGGDLLKLFQLAINQELEREEAVVFFKSAGYFRRVNKKLKDKLLDGILLNSFTGLTKIQQHHFRIRKRNLEVAMLIQSEKKNTAIHIAEETLLAAEKYGLIDIAIAMSRELEHHYSVIQPNTAKRQKYLSKNARYHKLFDQECQAQSLYNELGFSVQKKIPTYHIPESIAVLKDIAQINEQYKFRLYYYSVRILYAQYTLNQEEVIRTCKEASLFFSQSEIILPYTTAWNFKFQMIPVFLSRKEYAETEVTINECLKLPNLGSYNWHLTLLYKVVLGFYSNKPLIALNALKQAEKTPQKFKSAVIDERWKIITAYLSLYHKLVKVHFPKNFRTYRFLNDTKPNPTGKINLIIIEFLHLLIDGKKRQYMNRAENIESYIQTNLRGKVNARPKYFLRMLRAVETGDYHPLRVTAHAKKNYHLLMRQPTEMNINILDSEPVPYEKLWEMVMEILEGFRKSKGRKATNQPRLRTVKKLANKNS